MKLVTCTEKSLDTFINEILFSKITNPELYCVILVDTDKNMSDIYKGIISKISEYPGIELYKEYQRAILLMVTESHSHWSTPQYVTHIYFVRKDQYSPAGIGIHDYILHTYGIPTPELSKFMEIKQGVFYGNTFQL